MKGLHRPETTSRQLMRVTRLGSVLLPLAVLVFISAGYFMTNDGFRSENQLSVMLAAFSWIVLGIILTQKKTRYQYESAGWLIAYHIIMAAILILITGFDAPIVYLWSILLLMSFVFFGFRAFSISLAGLVAIGLLDNVLFDPSPISIGSNLIYSTIVAIVGGISVGMIRGADTDQSHIDDSLRQEELQRQQLTTLINNLAEAIINLDPQGRIKLYNAATLNLLDTNTSIDGKYIDKVLSFTDSDGKPVKLSKDLKSIQSVTVRDDLFSTISEETLRLELTISPVRSNYGSSNKKAGWIIIMRDVTAAKSLEEERDEFISVVSHELRTPIAIAEGTISNVQLILERGDIDEKTFKPAIDMAHEQILFLSKMVNDLSTLSRAERGVADAKEDIDVDELVHGLYTDYEPAATKKGLHLDLHMPAQCGTIRASRLYLKELLQNFITNAIKYTDKGTVTIDVTRSTDDTISFAITDTGIGISKSDQKRVFDKFYRAEDYRTRETSGTGLGLYVAAKLAKKLGTNIEMTSRLNHGSKFSIVISAKGE